MKTTLEKIKNIIRGILEFMVFCFFVGGPIYVFHKAGEQGEANKNTWKLKYSGRITKNYEYGLLNNKYIFQLRDTFIFVTKEEYYSFSNGDSINILVNKLDQTKIIRK